MARKNLLEGVINSDSVLSGSEGRADYALRGASKSMKVSIDRLAEDSKKLLDGETIVEIDPSLVDISFVSDRLSGDDQEYRELKDTIEAGQQDTPVLLRPHPKIAGRYMIVFGHRRVRVARDLKRDVRAVIKQIDDVAHILAQGQENTARADLSFIEKALFAKSLIELGQERELIQAALTIDKTLLSRMLSVADQIPEEVLRAIGPAKSVGRDRWENVKKLFSSSGNKQRALDAISLADFSLLESDKRFEAVLASLSQKTKSKRAKKQSDQQVKWSPKDGAVKGIISSSSKSYKLMLSANEADAFGAYLTKNLDQLYQKFKGLK
jgi:ParB family chromosome partitioning protein